MSATEIERDRGERGEKARREIEGKKDKDVKTRIEVIERNKGKGKKARKKYKECKEKERKKTDKERKTETKHAK